MCVIGLYLARVQFKTLGGLKAVNPQYLADARRYTNGYTRLLCLLLDCSSPCTAWSCQGTC